MRAILFDLGNTLINDQNQVLPGAIELLTAVGDLRDRQGKPVPAGLISDWHMGQDATQRAVLREQYLAIVRGAGLEVFFQPTDRRVTLSTDVGFFKPDKRIFRAALNGFKPRLLFRHAIFITENLPHVVAARALGMKAIHFKGPGQNSGEVDRLVDLLPLLQDWLTV